MGSVKFNLYIIEILANDENLLKSAFYNKIMEENTIKMVPLSGYPKEVREKAIELQKQGYNKTKIAELLGLGRTTVRRWLRQGNHPYLKPHPVEIKERAIEMVKRGMSRMSVSKFLGLSYFTVVFWCRGINVTPKNTVYPKKLKKNVRKLARLGMTKVEIAGKFRLPYWRILGWTADIRVNKQYTYLERLFEEGCILAKSSEITVLRELSLNLPEIRHVVIGKKHIFFLQHKSEAAIKAYLDREKLIYLSAKKLASIKTLFYSKC